MKLGHWLSQPPKAEPAASSRLVPALDPIREIREHSAWEPLTRRSNIQERAERVSTVRRQITLPPLARERSNKIFDYPMRIWFRESFEALLVVIASALVFLLVWLTMFAD